MEQTLEQEFLVYSMKHKCEITSAYFMHLYVQREQERSSVCTKELETKAEEYAYEKIKEFMLNGTLNDEYEKAWEYVAPFLPC